jgi:hypothetical protein
MKKMLLLLVSGLLIACMAGSAMASDTVLTPDTVYLHDGAAEVSTSIEITTVGTYQTQVYTDNSGLSAYIESSDPIAVGSSSNMASEIPIHGVSFMVSKPLPKIYTGTLHIKGNQAGTVTVETDTLKGRIFKPYSVETVGASIPEFPTVAAPVAAVLGLLFVFGRKKEGL